MQKRQTKVLWGLALLSVVSSGVVLACGSGSGPYPGVDPSYDPPPISVDDPPNSRDNPGNTRDNPGDTRDNPGSSVDNPGVQGPGPNSLTNCPPCDGTFKCTASTGGKSGSETLVLKTVNGTCESLDSKGKPDAVIACGGAITSDDGNGTWQRTGADSFSATVTGTETVSTNGQTSTTQVTVNLVCTRQSSSTNPAGTATSTGTATSPSPTTTATSVPFDAGTKG